MHGRHRRHRALLVRRRTITATATTGCLCAQQAPIDNSATTVLVHRAPVVAMMTSTATTTTRSEVVAVDQGTWTL